MARYLRTNLDPDGKVLRVESALRSSDGKCFLVLHRLPPIYAKPPTFVVELTNERVEVRGCDVSAFFKAYAHQEFTDKELSWLKGLKEGGTHAPFFNFSYPNILKRMGKAVYRFTDAELSQMVLPHPWKLVSGR